MARSQHATVSDIIQSTPWECDNKDCPLAWHLGNYWIHNDGYTYDAHADGNHVEIEEGDLPTHRESRRAWLQYYKHVLNTNEDPIGECPFPQLRTVKETWSFRFSKSILGFVVTEAKHSGQTYYPHQLPKHIRLFLNLPDTGAPVLQDSKTPEEREEFLRLFPKYRCWQREKIDHKVPYSRGRIARELRKWARKAIANAIRELESL